MRGTAIAPTTFRRLSLGIAGLAFCAGAGGALSQTPAPEKPLSSRAAGAHEQGRSASRCATLHGVSISHSDQSIIINVKADGPLRVTTARLPAPDRIVVDLEGARYSGRTLRMPISGGEVLELRISQFRSNPAITRIVLDVARTFPFEIVSYRHGLAIQVNTKEKAAARAQSLPAMPPQAIQPAPAATNEEIVRSVPDKEDLASVNGSTPSGVTPSTATAEAAAVIVGPARPLLEPDQLRAPISRFPTAELWASISVPAAENLAVDEEGPTTPHQAAKANLPVAVSGVSVSRQNGEIDVHIDATGRLRPTARVFANPDRIVVDLANAYIDRARRIPVHGADVKNVDVSLYLLNPPVTRIVLNLTRPLAYHLLGSGSTLVIRVDTHEPAQTRTKPDPKAGSPVTLLREPATR